MAEMTEKPKAQKKLVIRNIGLILSGMLEQPILDGDCVVALNGRIHAVGREKDLDVGNPDTLIGAVGIDERVGIANIKVLLATDRMDPPVQHDNAITLKDRPLQHAGENEPDEIGRASCRDRVCLAV